MHVKRNSNPQGIPDSTRGKTNNSSSHNTVNCCISTILVATAFRSLRPKLLASLQHMVNLFTTRP
jgi:hypothetical protein